MAGNWLDAAKGWLDVLDGAVKHGEITSWKMFTSGAGCMCVVDRPGVPFPVNMAAINEDLAARHAVIESRLVAAQYAAKALR